MNENKTYPIWHFITVPPYDWNFPDKADVICVGSPVSIFDIKHVVSLEIGFRANGVKLGYVAFDLLDMSIRPEDKQENVIERISEVISRLPFIDYIGCTNLYDRDGKAHPSIVSPDVALTLLGKASLWIGGKVFYRVDVKSLEEKHIARIYQMIRDGQIDTLVVDGAPDQITRNVLRVMEKQGLEIVVRPYDVR